MSRPLAASVVINNYNYGRFLRYAIESALAQTFHGVEVVVVDDGSTDGSRSIVESYGSRITGVFKPNGGQASAFNKGFDASRGDVVFFLDADDALMPYTVERVMAHFAEPDVVKVHWPLSIIDADGQPTGEVKEPDLPDGDFREAMRSLGPTAALPSAPTSGNAYRRSFLVEVMPMPEADFRLCADSYLFTLAPAAGLVRAFREPVGYFRKHCDNNYQRKPFAEKLRLGVAGYDIQSRALAAMLSRRGIAFDTGRWRAEAFWPRIERTLKELLAVTPEGCTIVLADEDQFGIGNEIAGRRLLPFLEKDEIYWGRPADDESAIIALKQLVAEGASILAFAWPARWWLEHYTGFANHLDRRHRRLLDNDRLVVFRLSDTPRGGDSP